MPCDLMNAIIFHYKFICDISSNWIATSFWNDSLMKPMAKNRRCDVARENKHFANLNGISARMIAGAACLYRCLPTCGVMLQKREERKRGRRESGPGWSRATTQSCQGQSRLCKELRHIQWATGPLLPPGGFASYRAAPTAARPLLLLLLPLCQPCQRYSCCHHCCSKRGRYYCYSWHDCCSCRYFCDPYDCYSSERCRIFFCQQSLGLSVRPWRQNPKPIKHLHSMQLDSTLGSEDSFMTCYF